MGADRGVSIGRDQQAAEIARLSACLDAFPVAFRGNPLHLLSLEDAHPIRSADTYLRTLDGLALCEERREYLLPGAGEWPFPSLTVQGRPDPAVLSQTLFEHLDLAGGLLLTQRSLGAYLCQEARKTDADIVALMVVDGLSYYDLPDDGSAIPCLVQGATITESGYRDVIGRPSVSQRLFALGYRRQLGLTYFDPEENALAADLYAVFGASQVVRISTIEEGLGYLRAERIDRGYVQLTAPGLDGLCHHHRDQPPREQYLSAVMKRFSALVDALSGSGRSVLACLTADHGILWREHLDGCSELAGDLLPEYSRHPRHIEVGLLRAYGRQESCGGRAHTLLRMPFLTRPLKRTEWGVHGGISAWESLVPVVVHQS